jgi:hypothetical protein
MCVGYMAREKSEIIQDYNTVPYSDVGQSQTLLMSMAKNY